MIVVDTSALIAIQFGEPEAAAMRDVLRSNTGVIVVGAPTLLEYYMVVTGKHGTAGRLEAAKVIEQLGVQVFNWTEDEVALALDAFERFGKGQHPARLNFGDCMAYATAKAHDAPLLFKGGDFPLTDVRIAQ